MPNSIKYSTSAETEALKSGNYYIGVGDVGKGPSDVTGYWVGITPPTNGYTLYGDKPAQGPSIYVASTDQELINLTKLISGQNISTADGAIQWFFQQSNRVIVNRDYETIKTNGLVVNLDSGFVASYPRGGSVWANVGPTGSATASLVNTPIYSSDVLSFSDTSAQYSTLPNIGNLSQWTVEVWFRLTTDLTGKCTAIVANQFDLVNKLNFSIGTNNFPTNSNLCVGFYDGSWRTTSGFTPTTNIWYHVVGTYDGNIITQYVDGVVNGSSVSYTGNPQSGGEIRMMRRWDSDTSANNLVNGDLGIVRVYNRALSADEVQSNYVAQSGRFNNAQFDEGTLALHMDASLPISYSGGLSWYDITDNGHVGSITGGVTYSASYGGVLDFDGVDGQITIPSSYTTTLESSYYRTIQIWARNRDLNPYILSKGGTSSNAIGVYVPGYSFNTRSVGGSTSSGALRLQISSDSQKQGYIIGTVSTYEWNFYTIITTLSAAPSSTRVYKNTTQILSATYGVDTYNESYDLYLGYSGRMLSATGSYFNGQIGAFYIYTRELSDSEITNNFLASKTRYGL